jgi:hypothetical protein
MKRLGIVALMFAIGCSMVAGCSEGSMQHAAKAPNAGAAPQAGDGKPEAAGKAIDRKIRYSGNVEVVVRDLDATHEAVEALVKSKNGYVAKSELVGSVGDRRYGTWTIKVPADSFREVVAALAKLGTLVHNSSDSEDFTEEYLDLEARVRNLKAEEDVLNKLLKDAANRLDDVLKMRDQIVRNRGDIERAEGRLKYLASVTSYSTINLTVREIQDYVPPTSPTFSSDVSDTFSWSYASLLHLGRGLVLFLVALAPWSPFLLAVGFAGWKIAKHWPAKKSLPIAKRLRVTEPAEVSAEPDQATNEKPAS